MDSGMVVLEGLVLFILAGYAFAIIGPPIIMNIIWIKRIKKGKSKIIGPLGIATVIVTITDIFYLPKLFTIIGGFFGWN